MKLGVVLTTINDPTPLLRLYQQFALPNVGFFIIGDLKTPSFDILGFYGYYDVARQKSLGYSCSELIGWNKPERRSIGFIEALKWGADVIITIDDDGIPLASTYFSEFKQLFAGAFDGLQVDSDTGWIDAGLLLSPPTPSRGYPLQLTRPRQSFSPVVNAKVGVAQGVILGDPDVSAITRIANAPEVHWTSELLRSGVIVPAGNWTVFNSQNTAFIRELAPAMFMWPGLGRDHDIFASLVCQRIMREKNCVTHFGRPFVYQQRNVHDLVQDLHDELLDYDHMLEFAGWLDQQIFHDEWTVTEMMRSVCERAPDLKWWPDIATKAGLAWCDDIEKVLR